VVALLDLADIIKVDFRRSDAKQRADIIKSHGAGRAAFLPEKVETLEEFFEARRLGYHYFQDCFFPRAPNRIDQGRSGEQDQLPAHDERDCFAKRPL